MKAQGLPMTTIVIIIIAIVALAVIAIFFFGGFSGGKESTKTFLDISFNKTGEARCGSAAFGGCPSDKPYCCSKTGECTPTCASCTGATTLCEDNVCRSSC